MAFTKFGPSEYFDGIDVVADNLVIPMAAVPELDEAEVVGGSDSGDVGDIRKVLFALLEQVWAEWPKAWEDKPVKMQFSKSVGTNTDTGVATQSFFVSFDTEISGAEVIDED